MTDTSVKAHTSLRWFLPLALIPHLGLAIFVGNRLLNYPDQDAYLSAANNIVAGRGLQISFDALGGFVRKGEPTSFFGLGEPLLLAVQIGVVGQNYFLLRLGNILLFSLSLFFLLGDLSFLDVRKIGVGCNVRYGPKPFLHSVQSAVSNGDAVSLLRTGYILFSFPVS